MADHLEQFLVCVASIEESHVFQSIIARETTLIRAVNPLTVSKVRIVTVSRICFIIISLYEFAFIWRYCNTNNDNGTQ